MIMFQKTLWAPSCGFANGSNVLQVQISINPLQLSSFPASAHASHQHLSSITLPSRFVLRTFRHVCA